MTTLEPPAFDAAFHPTRAPFLWLLEREIVRFLKIWRFSILGQVLSALLFVLVFGVALSGRVDAVDSIPYDRFILPGLVVQAVFIVGFVNGTTSLFEARNDRYIHGVLASPLRWWEINLALVLGGMVREVLVACGIFAVAGPFAGISLQRPAIALVAVLALLVSAAQIGVLAGNYARSLDHIYSFETLVILPLGFLSGVFYSIDALPATWRLLSHLNPAFYFVDLFRFGLLGQADVSPGVAVAVVLAVTAALTLWSLAVFRNAAQLKP